LLNDAHGAIGHLKPFMPTKEAKGVTDNAKVILAALRARPNEAAVSRVIALTENGKFAAVRVDAVDTLGHYAASPGAERADASTRPPSTCSPCSRRIAIRHGPGSSVRNWYCNHASPPFIHPFC
jgi:hypothetical protein